MLTRTTLLAAAALTALACSPPWGPPPDPNELLEADRAFAAETAARGADGWATWFAEQGRMYQERGYVDGRAAIRDAMVPAFADSLRVLQWAPDTAIVAASGDVGYTQGAWEAILRTPAGDSVLSRGNYLTIWQRQSDGTWKVAADIGNQAAPQQ